MDASLAKLIELLETMPGLGPRSARRLSLHLLVNKDLIPEIVSTLTDVQDKIQQCTECGNIDLTSPCAICSDSHRNIEVICLVESISDIWAIEKSGSFQGKYHVLGGTLSALHNITPEDLNINNLITRAQSGAISEIIIALGSTLDSQTTSFYITDLLKEYNIKITKLAHGIPMGADLEYIDDGTISVAFQSRSTI